MLQSLGKPEHGWLPVRIGLKEVRFDFRASNLAGDVVCDLILASAWLVQLETPFLKPSDSPVSRTIHFWREPKWNSLAFDTRPGDPNVSVAYFHEHKSQSAFSATPEDLIPLSPDLVGRFHRVELAEKISRAVDEMLRTTSVHEYLKHWKHPLNIETYGILVRALRMIRGLNE